MNGKISGISVTPKIFPDFSKVVVDRYPEEGAEVAIPEDLYLMIRIYKIAASLLSGIDIMEKRLGRTDFSKITKVHPKDTQGAVWDDSFIQLYVKKGSVLKWIRNEKQPAPGVEFKGFRLTE